MKRWALLVAGLYLLVLVTLTIPVWVTVSWDPDAHWSRAGDLAEIYAFPQYWLVMGVMLLCQFALLAVPVDVSSRRPVKRRSVWFTVLAIGLMIGLLVFGAGISLVEFLQPKYNPILLWVIGLAVCTWIGWAVFFYKLSRQSEPTHAFTRQCRLLFKGSVLELLVAVPTHIAVRLRHDCCAGILTTIGLMTGLAVMLFAFGPAVFFLFVERWRRLRPKKTAGPEKGKSDAAGEFSGK